MKKTTLILSLCLLLAFAASGCTKEEAVTSSDAASSSASVASSAEQTEETSSPAPSESSDTVSEPEVNPYTTFVDETGDFNLSFLIPHTWEAEYRYLEAMKVQSLSFQNEERLAFGMYVNISPDIETKGEQAYLEERKAELLKTFEANAQTHPTQWEDFTIDGALATRMKYTREMQPGSDEDLLYLDHVLCVHNGKLYTISVTYYEDRIERADFIFDMILSSMQFTD